jgi:flagellar protein FliS
MFGMMHNPAQTYAKVSVDAAIETADPHRLVLMLFDGAITAVVTGKNNMANNEIELKGINISKAINIITNGLKVSLDLESGGELAIRLNALYQYMAERLVWANLKNETATLDEVLGLLRELRGAWAEIPNQNKSAA